jgi:hypothetical protein
LADLVSTAEVAAAVGVSEQTIRHHAATGHLPGAQKVGAGSRAMWIIPAEYANPDAYRAAVGPARGTPSRRRAKGLDE